MSGEPFGVMEGLMLPGTTNVLEFRRRAAGAGWTLTEHQLIVQLAGRMKAEVEFGRAEDGAPWAYLIGGQVEVSIVREAGTVAMLNPHGELMCTRSSVRGLIAAFEGTWWVKGAA